MGTFRAAVREHLHADGPQHENLDPTPAMQRCYLIDALPPQVPVTLLVLCNQSPNSVFMTSSDTLAPITFAIDPGGVSLPT